MLKDEITIDEISKIFANSTNKKKYLKRLFGYLNLDRKIPNKKTELDSQIIDTWNYDISKNILRNLFIESEKYSYCQNCKYRIDNAINEWKELELGEFQWPFSAMGFDQHIHSINRNNKLKAAEKDVLVSQEIVKFRRIKELNTLRNDYIEYLIFNSSDNIIPTFGNNRGVDFYIDGNPYDQKVAKSVGNSFQQEYGENYRTTAIERPDLVAKSLYENQDEERFGDEPRLFVVYLDSDIDSESIEEQIISINFEQPIDITFDYIHSNNTTISHTTKCFIVLLHS